MSNLKNLWLILLLSSQVLNGNSKENVSSHDFSVWGMSKILNLKDKNKINLDSSDVIYEILQEDNNIAYSLKSWANIYKDQDGKQILCKSPRWVVIRKNAINEDFWSEDFLCVEYKWYKAYINKTDLVENDGKSLYELEKPTTEKVIRVNKEERIMRIYDQYWKNKVKEFKIAISFWDDWDKVQEWDWNTPVGKYYICAKNPASSFWRNPKTWWKLWSLHVSYPNSQDAFEWLISWDISQSQFNSINSSIKSKWVPSQWTKLWNYIMIHGWWAEYDWTIWCMAVDDEDMLRLYNFINTWTDLYIE